MMMLAANPPNSNHQFFDFERRQRPGSGLADYPVNYTTTTSTPSPSFSSALQSVSLALDDGQDSPFLSRFQNSLTVPFTDQYSPEPHLEAEDEEEEDTDDRYMQPTSDYYNLSRTQQTATPRSASSQQQSQSRSQSLGDTTSANYQSQWVPYANQSHLAAPSFTSHGGTHPRPRFHDQLAGHTRNNSGSTVTSTGPNSPFTPAVQTYPHIHDPEAAQHYPSPLVDTFDLHQQQHVYTKPHQTYTDPSFLAPPYPVTQPQQYPLYQPHGDQNYAQQAAMRRAMMSQESHGSGGGAGRAAGIPSLSRLPTGEFDRNFKATLEARGNVPNFDRTLSDMCQDELYNPNLNSMPPVSQPPRPATNISHQMQTASPHRDMFSERLQAANSGHLSARSGTPSVPGLSRDRSPFQPTSEYARDEISSPHVASPMSRLGSAAQLRERQKAEADAIAYAQQHNHHQQSLEESNTISPQDALLDNSDPDLAEAMPSLFPQNGYPVPYPSMQRNRSADQSAQQPQAQQQTNRRRSQPKQQPQQQQQQQRPQQYAPQYASQESNPEFPAHLTSMESTRSESLMNGTSSVSSSQQSDTQVTASELPQRPANTGASTGAFACTQHGCSQRFDSSLKLQRHKREAHRHASPKSPASPAMNMLNQQHLFEQDGSPTGAALAARNSQAGPHKCERTNPSTGKPCNSIFSRPYDLTRHEDTIHNIRKQKVRCRYCAEEKTFSRSDALTRHMRVVHPEMEMAVKRGRRG